MTGIFAQVCRRELLYKSTHRADIVHQASIAATDGATEIPGGWLDGHFVQLGYQLADTVAATAYAFVITYCLVALIDCVPGLEVSDRSISHVKVL